MATEGGGQSHEVFNTVLAWILGLGAWFLQFIVTRRYLLKDQAKKENEDRINERELKELLEEDIRKRSSERHHHKEHK